MAQKYKNMQCPYCQSPIALVEPFYKEYINRFDLHKKSLYSYNCISVTTCFFHCPSCNETSIFVRHLDNDLIPIKPLSFAKKFPEYIPAQIRKDYEEAYAILNLSPKASATLSRRCLQGMIHDFWKIKEKNLNAEISSLKALIPAEDWSAINSLRELGNIGAHMESDVNLIVEIEPSEAKDLLSLIEYLLNVWYVTRYQHEQLLSNIKSSALNKKLTKRI